MNTAMNVERYLRMIAGIAVLASLALGYFVHPGFLLFTAFVGLNLFQSAFTDWCPVKTVLEKMGVPACGAIGGTSPKTSVRTAH